MGLPPSFVYQDLPSALPNGYAPVSLSDAQGELLRTPLRVAIILKAEGSRASLVTLHETLDARSYLAAVLDSNDRVHRWLELSVQDSSAALAAPAAYREALNNASLDARWTAACDAAMATGDAGFISTGYEREQPPPLFIDAKTKQFIKPRDKRTNATWALCTDEALLAKKSAASYSGTMARHLYQPELGDAGDIMPLDVLGNDPAALTAALGIAGEPIALNAGCGLMSLRPLAALSLEQYADAIKSTNSDAGAGDSVLRSIMVASERGTGGTIVNGGVNGFLRLTGVGVAGRLIEALNLQLMAISQAVKGVRAWTAATQSPLLNITSGSFAVAMPPPAFALPFWWTARTELMLGGDAAELMIPNARTRYFLPGHVGGSSIYSPTAMARASSGRGFIRPRNITPEGAGQIVECTLSTQERISAGPNDLLWLRAGSGQSRIDLHCFIDQQSALATGEIRLRSLPQKLSEATQARLRSGTPISDAAFELVPLLSTPCDLYALGVLAVRVLLVDAKRALPVAMDEVQSLAASASQMIDSGLDLPARIARVIDSDKRFAESLGPHHILGSQYVTGSGAGLTYAEASAVIPSSLWCKTLAMIVRMLTGIGPDSRCSDFGEAPVGAIHRVFDSTLDEAHHLLGACRTLIVNDHELTTEVRSVLAGCAAGIR